MDYRFVVYGIVLVIMMRFRPQGALGWKSKMPYKFPKLARQKLERRKKDGLVTEQV
jgi:branched-chain amino acid transport system permease protein